MESVETIVVGAGQAGLATSYFLCQAGREHLVLEQSSRPGHVWTDERWDSFTLVTPNWAVKLPGAEYGGERPGEFMPRAEMAAYLEQYAERFRLPIRYDTTVTGIDPAPSGHGYAVQTTEAEFYARNVVVATGVLQKHKLPKVSSQLPMQIAQLNSGQYRNPRSLAPGAVLVVGSGQSGCQIVEDLCLAGRQVYLCVGSAGRAVRRYRGRDLWDWLMLSGFLERTPEVLPSPQARFAGAPHVTGARGGHSISLHQFARDGVVLLGRLAGARDGTIQLAPDLMENLGKADKYLQDLLKLIDTFIDKSGISAPLEQIPPSQEGYQAKVIRELDLRQAGITSIIWASGFSFDYSWVRPAALDEFGYPTTGDGVANVPGLYFAGFSWLPKFKMGLLVGVADSARAIAGHIAS